MNAQLVLLNDIEALREAGVGYPDTIDAWRWLFRCRAERGLDKAFVRIGRRILVDVPAYLALARNAQSRAKLEQTRA